MENKQDKLALRKDLKKKKYTFVVKESKFFSGVKKRWRFPRGKHSKVRQMHRGRPALPQPGHGSPKEVRGLHSSGLKPYLLSKVADLESLDNKVHGIVISSSIGNRKKITLIETALEKEFKILNLRDSVKAVKEIKDQFEERKKVKKDKTVVKQKKTEEKKKKAAKKAKEDKDKESDKKSSNTESKEAKKADKSKDKKDLSEMLGNDEKESKQEVKKEAVVKAEEKSVDEKKAETKTDIKADNKDNKEKVEVKND